MKDHTLPRLITTPFLDLKEKLRFCYLGYFVFIINSQAVLIPNDIVSFLCPRDILGLSLTQSLQHAIVIIFMSG